MVYGSALANTELHILQKSPNEIDSSEPFILLKNS